MHSRRGMHEERQPAMTIRSQIGAGLGQFSLVLTLAFAVLGSLAFIAKDAPWLKSHGWIDWLLYGLVWSYCSTAAR
jgi:hypothetical protein